MSYAEFCSACSERTIYSSVAVENDAIREALKNRNDEEVLRLLDEEF